MQDAEPLPTHLEAIFYSGGVQQHPPDSLNSLDSLGSVRCSPLAGLYHGRRGVYRRRMAPFFQIVSCTQQGAHKKTTMSTQQSIEPKTEKKTADVSKHGHTIRGKTANLYTAGV